MAGNADSLRLLLVETFHDVDVLIEALRHDHINLFAPDMVYEDANLPDHIGEVYCGQEGILRAAERWREGSDSLTLTLDEIIGDGDDIVSIHEVHAEVDGVEFVGPVTYHWNFHDGKVVHLQSYRSREDALSSAGLSETS